MYEPEREREREREREAGGSLCSIDFRVWTRFFAQPFFVTSLITKCPTFAKK